MLGYRKVYNINGRLIVAHDLNEAIDTFNEWMNNEGIVIKHIELIGSGDGVYDAIMRE